MKNYFLEVKMGKKIRWGLVSCITIVGALSIYFFFFSTTVFM